jgi:hypothetical protein
MQTKDRIRQQYWLHKIDYEPCLDALVALGMTEGAADDFIHGNTSVECPHCRLGFYRLAVMEHIHDKHVED